MLFEKPRINRLAAPESLRYAMPELDAGFTQLPAQVNLLALVQRRKIDQPDIQIFYHATELENFSDGLFQSGSSLLTAKFRNES